MTRIPQPPRDAPASEWHVYADALQEANDPRGMLIALADRPAERDAHVVQHAQALFGPAAEHADAFAVDWKWCLPEVVEIAIQGGAAAALVDAFLRSPLAQDVRTVALVGVAQDRLPVDLAAGVQQLLEQMPASVRSLAFVDQRAARTTMLSSRDFAPDDNLVTFGSLADVWKVPGLEEVRIEVADVHQLELGAIAAPALRAFTLRSLRFGAEPVAPVVDRLNAARWPALRSFELRLPEEFYANEVADDDAYITHYPGSTEGERGEDANGTNWELLAPLLANLATCPLERLALTSFDSAESLLSTLEAAGWARSLVELDLSDSSVSDVTWFERNLPRLQSVQRLVLERTPISEAGARRLATLGPAIRWSAGEGATYRYVVGAE